MEISTIYRQENSHAGHSLDVLKSGLQKYIRRANIEGALYCAAELDLLGAEPGGVRIATNFYHRLYIILLEDVANVAIIPACVEDIKQKTPGGIVAAIQRMCASPKVRIGSHARAVFSQAPREKIAQFSGIAALYEEIDAGENSYTGLKRAVDEKNTPRALFHAFRIHYDIVPAEKVGYKRKIKPTWYIFKILNGVMDTVVYEFLYMQLQATKESFLTWCVPLCFYLGVIVESKLAATAEPIAFAHIWTEHADKTIAPRIFEDYILDQHTRSGRGQSRATFVAEGARVEPEAPRPPQWKEFYELDFYAAETERFEFIGRIQLVTSKTKQDVYLARDGDKQVIVKGPYTSKAAPQLVLTLNTWKRAQGLACQDIECIFLYPDRWPEGTPLGARNSLPRDEAAPFLVFPSLFEGEVKFKEHSSKLWPATNVVDFTSSGLNMIETELTSAQRGEYIVLLLYRYVFGISDLADRNFLVVGGHILSIDEETAGREVSFQKELRAAKCGRCYDYLEAHFDDILSIVKGWRVPKENSARFKVICDRDACMALFLAPKK